MQIFSPPVALTRLTPPSQRVEPRGNDWAALLNLRNEGELRTTVRTTMQIYLRHGGVTGWLGKHCTDTSGPSYVRATATTVG